MEVLKISSKSNPNSVAGAIAGLVKEVDRAEMQAIGAGALNQAVKAVAIARGFGFQNILKTQLFEMFPSQSTMIENSLTFFDK